MCGWCVCVRADERERERERGELYNRAEAKRRESRATLDK